MEKPFITLSSKEFLSGIAPSAHTNTGGIFFKADGITPLYDAGGTASVENGLLQAGPAPTNFTSTVVVDNIFAGVETSFSGTAYLYMLGSSGHFYRKAVGSGAVTDLRDGTTAATPTFTADKTAATDLIENVSPTVTALGIVNGGAIKYLSATHGGLTQNTTYYAGNVSGNTFKLYNDIGITSLVDITVDGASADFQYISVISVIATSANGMTVWGPAGGTPLLFYWRQGFIGTWDMSSTYPLGWNDIAYDIDQGTNSTTLKPVHQFEGNVYYGNGDRLGGITDDGDTTFTYASNLLDFPLREQVTGIADDGTYLVIATTENYNAQNSFSKNYIYFWDTHGVSWQRRVLIKDPFIWAVKNIGGAVYAFGQYGIYQVTYGGSVTKVLSRLIGFGTTSDLTAGYGTSRATVYNNDALMFCTDTTIDTFGKLEPDVPNAYLKPFKVPSAVGTPTFVSADLDAGRVYVATDTAKLYAYDFNGATHDTGNTAQTVYLRLPGKMSIKRIDLVFGEPLASGDAISAGVFKDQDTAATDFGSATFAANGAIRRKSLYKQIEVDDQMSILLTYTTGAVKVRAIECYGESLTP